MPTHLLTTVTPGGYTSASLTGGHLPCQKPAGGGKPDRHEGNYPLWIRGDSVFTSGEKMTHWFDDAAVRHFATDELATAELGDGWAKLSPDVLETSLFKAAGFRVATSGFASGHWRSISPRSIFVPIACVEDRLLNCKYTRGRGTKMSYGQILARDYKVDPIYVDGAVQLWLAGAVGVFSVEITNGWVAAVAVGEIKRTLTEAEWVSLGYTAARRDGAGSDGLAFSSGPKNMGPNTKLLQLGQSVEEAQSGFSFGKNDVHWGSGGLYLDGSVTVLNPAVAAALSGESCFANLPVGTQVSSGHALLGDSVRLTKEGISDLAFKTAPTIRVSADGSARLEVSAVARISGPAVYPSILAKLETDYLCEKANFADYFIEATAARRRYAVPTETAAAKVHIVGEHERKDAFPATYLLGLPGRGEANAQKRKANDAKESEIKAALGFLPDGYDRALHSSEEAIATGKTQIAIEKGEVISLHAYAEQLRTFLCGGSPAMAHYGLGSHETISRIRESLAQITTADSSLMRALFGPHTGYYMPAHIPEEAFLAEHGIKIFRAIDDTLANVILKVLATEKLRDALVFHAMIGKQ